MSQGQRVALVALISAFFLTACNFIPWESNNTVLNQENQATQSPQRSSLDYHELIKNEHDYISLTLDVLKEMQNATQSLEQTTADPELVDLARSQAQTLVQQMQTLENIKKNATSSAQAQTADHPKLINDLSSLSGRELEVSIANGLIAQHEALAEMSEIINEMNPSEAIKTHAQNVIQNSQEEIAAIQDWLGSRDAKTLPVSNPE